jgi:hypothetical protein
MTEQHKATSEQWYQCASGLIERLSRLEEGYDELVARVDPLESRLRSAWRPKPPSLKEQALEQLACIQTDLNKFGMGISTNTIRRALEALDD